MMLDNSSTVTEGTCQAGFRDMEGPIFEKLLRRGQSESCSHAVGGDAASHRPQPARRSLVALVHRWSIDVRLFRMVRVLLDCTLSSALTDANTVAPLTPAVLSARVSCSSWAQDNPYRRSRTSSRCPAVGRALGLVRGALRVHCVRHWMEHTHMHAHARSHLGQRQARFPWSVGGALSCTPGGRRGRAGVGAPAGRTPRPTSIDAMASLDVPQPIHPSHPST